MTEEVILKLKEKHPVVKDIFDLKETTWINENKLDFNKAISACKLSLEDVIDASDRLKRFADFFKVAFPETSVTDGILESPIKELPSMKKVLEKEKGICIPGKLWAKLDNNLPISGSIKARGGIYEVLYIAEKIALEKKLITKDTPYKIFNSEKMKSVFSDYSIAVGSTGNLGLSIGIISAKLGFKVTVHMSSDAKAWKKDLLRSIGVTVKEYDSDYSVAVKQGRKEAENDKYCHFIDDENSKTLFLGYSVAGLRLKNQLKENGIEVNKEHPLFVYLPCGVGGGPGGAAFGLKLIFGDNVHCFFAEPTHSACMMLGMATGLHNNISVQDLGIDNKTAADGLAVGRASGFVGKLMTPFISGCYSLEDSRMYRMLAQISDSENLKLEPSALAGVYGITLFSTDDNFLSYLKNMDISKENMKNANHIAWLTGGGMVPENEMENYYKTGKTYEYIKASRK